MNHFINCQDHDIGLKMMQDSMSGVKRKGVGGLGDESKEREREREREREHPPKPLPVAPPHGFNGLWTGPAWQSAKILEDHRHSSLLSTGPTDTCREYSVSFTKTPPPRHQKADAKMSKIEKTIARQKEK
jgi:hypothetical protein